MTSPPAAAGRPPPLTLLTISWTERPSFIEANLNRFVEDRPARFLAGTFDRVKFDASTNIVHAVEFNDTFSGYNMDFDRWRLAAWRLSGGVNISSSHFVGMENRQFNGLSMAFPRGYCSLRAFDPYPGYDGSGPILNDSYSVFPSSPAFGVVEHRQILHGDFDIQVDFH